MVARHDRIALPGQIFMEHALSDSEWVGLNVSDAAPTAIDGLVSNLVLGMLCCGNNLLKVLETANATRRFTYLCGLELRICPPLRILERWVRFRKVKPDEC